MTNCFPNEFSRIHSLIVYIICLIECIVFGGAIFGWAQLSFVLKKEGIYNHLCEGSNETTSLENVSIRNFANTVHMELYSCIKVILPLKNRN